MAVTRRYRCSQCGFYADEAQSITAPLLTVCPTCRAPSYTVVPQVPAAVVYRGGTPSQSRGGFVNGGVKLRREKVIQNPDGSETIYRTLEDATRGELERCPHPLMAKANVQQHIVKGGYVPGTRQAALAQALDDRVSLTPKLGTGGM